MIMVVRIVNLILKNIFNFWVIIRKSTKAIHTLMPLLIIEIAFAGDLGLVI